MKDCVIYCAGIHGAAVYEKISKIYRVVAYSDSNEKLWGAKCNGVTVLPPSEIVSSSKNGAAVFVCNVYHSKEIAAHLAEIGCENIYCIPGGLLYEYADGLMRPIKGLSEKNYYKKTDEKTFSILYVQDRHCQRTNKFASVVKRFENVKVFAAYTIAPPKSEWRIYDGEFEFWNLDEMYDFVKNSDFDIIHSSNEPDCFSALLRHTGKPVIHDTHDMASLVNIDANGLVMEYMVNSFSAGRIHVSDGMMNIAVSKYENAQDDILVVENLLLESFLPKHRLNKLSDADGQIHCVYEGGINIGDAAFYNFDEIWGKLADCGIHVHFYSATDNAICAALEKKNAFFHYEGSLPLDALLAEMTKYDCGLCMFDRVKHVGGVLDVASINKFYEYLGAGLPVAVSGTAGYAEFLKRHNVGKYIDFSKDLREQFEEIRTLRVPNNFLLENKLTFDAYGGDIIQFYKKMAERNLIK